MAVDIVARGMAAEALSGGGGGSSTLAGLTDVDISNPTNGQTLVYNATSGKWENGQGSSGGGVLVVNMNPETLTLDKTYAEIAASPAVVILNQTQTGEIYRSWVTAAIYDAINDEYVIYAVCTNDDKGVTFYYFAGSENDYPVQD